ncbi:MAG: MG2 domain-containing protein [Sandaracinaceae bacterium]
MSAHAQAEPAADGASVGYELALAGAPRGERGHQLTLTGVGYEVDGLATLRAQSGLEVVGRVTERDERGTGRHTVTDATTRTGAGGTFTLRVDLPDRTLRSPQLELELHRVGQPGRRFLYGLSTYRDVALDLLTDRNRYQPGEAVHAWVRVRGIRAEAPLSGRRIKLELLDQSGQPLADHEATTGASGVVTAALELPDGAEAGHYRVRAVVLGEESGPEVSRSVQVWRRTVERLLAEVHIDRADEDGVALVRPGGPLAGRVEVTTPSGTPVRGASVEVRVREGAPPVELVTNGEGVAAFDLRVPTYLAGDVGSNTLTARATHSAYGTITASARYIVSRVPAVVSASARGGALVPEVDSTVYVSVSDPRGRPLIRGTEIVVRGPGLPADGRTAQLDPKGFAEVVVRLPRGAASTMQGGSCAGRVATTFEVEVRTDPPRFSRACVPVSAEAELALEVTSAPLVAPGSTTRLRVQRRPEARGRPILVEALFGGRAVASTWIDGRAETGDLVLPDDLLGILQLRARALRGANDREPSDEPGATAFGVGALDAVLVRPADAFSLDVTPERPRYLVREHANVALTASDGAAQGWAALLVRDEAAHGGEGPWDLYWMRGALHEAAQHPNDETLARFLRASLSASLGVDPEPPRPPELEPPYWRGSRHHSPYHEGVQAGRGVLRDPTALREELLRRGLAPYEMLLEQLVAQLGPVARDRAPIVQGRSFHPQVIEHLIARHQLNARSARTLGGEPLTVAMIEGADPGFSFDIVARRVARQRLSRLLLALLHLSDPDNQNAQRASANLPPERWLGTLVQLSMVQAQDLTDPWGHPYVFRRVTGRRPRVAISDRALEWELASPGPDGRLNTADDVNDPFARAVPAGTPYAVTSGEEQLMRMLAALAPASTVLTRMGQAYQRLSLAAQEEQVSGPVGASGSEVADESVVFAETESAPSRGRRSGGGGGRAEMDGLVGAMDDEGGDFARSPRRPAPAGRGARPRDGSKGQQS